MGRGGSRHKRDERPCSRALSHPLSTTGGMLLQSRCAGCDRVGVALCRTCRFALAGPAPRAVLGWAEGGVVAAVPFTGRVRDVILGFKYRNRRQLAGHLAGLLVNRLVAEGIRPGRDVDVVTWAPTSAASPASARLRPGRTGRPPGRPPAGPAVAPAARANHRRRSADRSWPRPAARRSVVRGPSPTCAIDGCSSSTTSSPPGRRCGPRPTPCSAREHGAVVRAAVASTPSGLSTPGRVLVGPWALADSTPPRRRSA